MKATLAQVRSFNRPIRLLLVNQLTINVGFYMLMPYLALYLSDDLGLAAWLVGLVLGVRNLSQQGMFLLGGSLADRIGYKPMIMAGLVLRSAGFALLGLVEALPALIIASALTGLAGALFNPAARAYLAQEAGERKVEAFALFNVFYQMGILIGPLIGLLLGGVAFRLICLVAAGLFTILAVVQARALPARAGGRAAARDGLFQDWRRVAGNRAFLWFSLAMIGSYVLNFQVYLGLPIEVRRMTGGEMGVTLLFVLSGGLAIIGQVHVTAWAKARWTSGQAMVRGLWLMGAAFLPLAFTTWLPPIDPDAAPWPAQALALTPVLVTTGLLSLATMIVYPFEMTTIVTLGGERMVGTYYGFYNTLSGIGIALGNLLTGAALDAGRELGVPGLPWVGLAAIGGLCATAVFGLNRSGRLIPDRERRMAPA
ncbi:MFS transporter [Planomonospora parontospora]|uniref:MFS transporter n=1 Tax=Planomonospora parontospora TaxID=58119 RepID=UPI00166FCE37|nr:MFS transporter [Planomonospora parontospora]GGL59676.1 putative ABC transporter, permease protein [Planomonospora parontospora subsp. antibiotica]GII20338.1 putative ABC transporter, permease protein [Planomonospora parontospora subsp. antibiotica]